MSHILRQAVAAAAVTICATTGVAQIPGVSISTISISGGDKPPTHFTVGPDNNAWWLDGANKSVNKMVISGSTATVTKFAVPGANLTFPSGNKRGITSDANVIWFSVLQSGTAMLGKVTTDGTITMVPISGETQIVRSMAVGADQSIYISFTDDDPRTPTDHLARVTPQGAATLIPTSASCCMAMSAGSDGNVWVRGKGIVGRVSSGAIKEFPASVITSTTFPLSIAYGADGNVYYDDLHCCDGAIFSQIGQLNPSNGQEKLFDVASHMVIGGVTTAIDGTVWFTDHNSFRIGRLDPATGSVAMQNGIGSGAGSDIAPMTLPASGKGLDAAPVSGSVFAFLASFFDQSQGGSLALVRTAIAPPAPDLTIKKTHLFYPNTKKLAWGLFVTNVGTAPTSGRIIVNDDLPTGFGTQQKLNLGLTLNEGCDVFEDTRKLVCTFDDALAPGKNLIFEVSGDITAADGTTLTNQATVSGGGETNTTNDTSNIDTFPVGKAVIEVTKSHSGDRFLGTFQWAIRIKNVGVAATDGPVTITDALPDGVTLQPFGDLLGAKCSVSGSTVVCTTDAALPPGGKLTIPLVVASIPKSGILQNFAVAAAGTELTTSQPDIVADRVGTSTNKQPVQNTTVRH